MSLACLKKEKKPGRDAGGGQCMFCGASKPRHALKATAPWHLRYAMPLCPTRSAVQPIMVQDFPDAL